MLWGGITYDEVVQGGPICVASSPMVQRVCESIFGIGLSLFILGKSWPRVWADVKSSSCKISATDRSDTIFSQQSVARVLLLVFTLVFGIEVGFKLASRSLIWLMFPCHIATMAILVSYLFLNNLHSDIMKFRLQLSLVLPQSSPIALTIFRIATYWMNGATVALIYHVTATRQLNGEVNFEN